MNVQDNPLIREMADTDEDVLVLFSPLNRAVIEVCKDIVNNVVADSANRGVKA